MSRFLEFISAPDLAAFIDGADEVFPKFTTVNNAYKEQLLKLKDQVGSYFADETLQRPLSYLILGPPGAGKSFLMSKLVDQLERDKPATTSSSANQKTFAFQSINLSEVVDPRELHKLYEAIRENTKNNRFTVTLIDEVDVRWTGSSAIKHLINPMYDGQYWDGSHFNKFGRCAFFFAGSYLQDRQTLLKTQEVLSGVDLNKFLLDLYLELRKQGEIEELRRVERLQSFCRMHKMWHAEADPHVDTILYLRSLEKIRDFLSRIAGNYFEMIDVSAPLHVTDEPFTLTEGQVAPTSRMKPSDVSRFIKRSERSADGRFQSYREFEFPYQPLLEYKDVLLRERLLRVLNSIEKRFGETWPPEMKQFKIQRKLLNLLTVAPLINGMRSLEQLINLLDLTDPGRPEMVQRRSPFKLEEISMVVHDAEDYADADSVWFKMRGQNRPLREAAVRVDENGLITVPIKRKPKT